MSRTQARQNAVVKTLLPIPKADPAAAESASEAAGKGSGPKAENSGEKTLPFSSVPSAAI